jgi:histidine kinase/DNA gyrase B/HSP90-like ATPase
MTSECLSRIFNAFQRMHPRTTDGLGLGLFLARQAAQLLGHRIQVRSVPSLGSHFSVYALMYQRLPMVTLPRSRNVADANHPAEARFRHQHAYQLPLPTGVKIT